MRKLRFLMYNLVLMVAPWSYGDDITWSGPDNGLWSEAANWTGGFVPSCGDVAVFASGSATVLIDSDIKIEGIRLEAGFTGTLFVTSGSCFAGQTAGAPVNIMLGEAGYTQYGGSFVQGNGAFVSYGPVLVESGSFDGCDETLTEGSKLLNLQWDMICDATVFSILSDQPKGGYIKVSPSKPELHFSYREEYQAGNLAFKIFDKTRQVKWSNTNEAISKQYGENNLTLNLQSAALTVGDFYFLEVMDEKEKKYYLRFKYSN